MNAPDRFLTWRWEDDYEDEAVEDASALNNNLATGPAAPIPVAGVRPKKLVYAKDSKRPNAGTFILAKEDHTLGNLIRIQLLRDPKVRFAGYRMPHPLIFDCHIRIETMDAISTPKQVLDAALNDLQMELDTLDREFDVSPFFVYLCLFVFVMLCFTSFLTLI